MTTSLEVAELLGAARAAERRHVQEALALPALAALRCIPDGPIRNGCLLYDGEQVRETFRAAYLKLTADPTAATPALDVQVDTEWGVWFHSGDSDGIVLSREQFSFRKQAVRYAESRIGDYGIDRYTIVRREHHRFPKGAPFDVAITPWVVDERVTPAPKPAAEVAPA